MRFYDNEHEQFFINNMTRCRRNDAYHQSLIYLLGLTEDTRRHIDEIYDFSFGCVDADCLQAGWITSTTARLIRFAFNLYTDGAPSCFEIRNKDKMLDEALRYMPSNIFCCDYAPYYWEALQIRFPATCY